jgi:hypothetical protein
MGGNHLEAIIHESLPSAFARFWSRLTFDLDMPVSSAMSLTESPALGNPIPYRPYCCDGLGR